MANVQQFSGRVHPDQYAIPARASHWQNQVKLLADNFGRISVATDEILGRKILELPDMKIKDVNPASYGVGFMIEFIEITSQHFPAVITSAVV